ncbi:alpha/beta hydrolase family protein [mine drainage metagenome]|uniref:Alpha/beta hydrolase family protein n=1 Tax=mine drainage metagenome TaxID=410659 RepID=A0A1J5PD10_9ZZZZ
MTPLRFHNGERELFGLYLEPRPGTARGHAVLLCNPFGQEAIRAHRLYRVLGDRLTAAGFHVLRFDYYGSGDSAGDDAEFDLDGAIADTAAAGALLLQRSQAQRLSCAGLRLGGNIAALASNRWPDPVEHLVLFEPVAEGAAHLIALKRSNASTLAEMFAARWRLDAALRQFNLPDPDGEALGFALTPSCKAQITDRVTLSRPWPGHARNTLLLTPQVETFAAWTAKRDVVASPSLQVTASDSDIDWATNSALNTAIVPRAWVDRLLGTLTETLHA